MSKEKHTVYDYIKLCTNLQDAGILAEVMLIIFDDPYIKTRVYTDMRMVEYGLTDKRVEFNIHSFNKSKNTCNLTIFVNFNE